MFFNPSKPKLLLALDIGASFVRGVLFWAHKDGKPEVAGLFKVGTKLLEKVTLEMLERNIISATRGVFGNVAKSAPHRVNGIFVSFSSPWYFSETRILAAERSEEFLLSEDFLSGIIAEDEKRMLADAARKFSVTPEELVVPEKHHMRYFLNGYAVSNVYGKKARSFRAPIYMSAVPHKLTGALESAAAELLGYQKIHFHSAPFIKYRVLGEVFDAERGFLSVEIGEEITDVMFVHDGIVEEISSFARGGDSLVRRLASLFRISPEEALSHLRMYAAGKLNEKETRRIKKVVDESVSEWLVFIKRIAEHFRAITAIPERVFVFGSSPVIKFFSEALAGSADLASYTVTVAPLNVNILVPDALKEGFFKNTKLTTHEETTVAFLVLFFNKHVWEKTEK